MKPIKLGILALAAAAAFSACGKDGDNAPIVATAEAIVTEKVNETASSAAEETVAETADDSTPPREGMVRSRLTNEWVDADVANSRPIAVMTPNESSALPHYNLSQASILYEADVEGSMTRMMAVYEDWKGLDKIGNIRSLRAYYAYWAMEWDAFIVHIGGPFFVDEVLNKANVEDIDGKTGAAGDAFFRTSDRKAPHNAYASGSGIEKVANALKYDMEYRGIADDAHYKFASKSSPNTLDQYPDAVDAAKVDMSGCWKLTRCYFEYNEEDGLYYRSQHLSGASKGPHIDAVNGEQLTFSNILVQDMVSEELGQGYLAFQVHDNKRSGWYFTQGKGIRVTWTKTSDWGATRYYDESGNEITLNTGKTMVCIVRNIDNLIYE